MDSDHHPMHPNSDTNSVKLNNPGTDLDCVIVPCPRPVIKYLHNGTMAMVSKSQDCDLV